MQPGMENAILAIRNGIRPDVPGLDRALASTFLHSREFERAAERFGRRLVEEGMPAVFTETERERLAVIYSSDPVRILQDSGQRYPADWEHTGTEFPSHNLRVEMVIAGTFNRAMSLRGAMDWALAQTDRKLRGSGAYVRLAYINAHPRYDGKGSRHFPDEGASRWRHKFDKHDPPGEFGPGLWHDGGTMGPFSLDWIEGEQSAGHIFHFILDESKSK